MKSLAFTMIIALAVIISYGVNQAEIVQNQKTIIFK